MFAIKSMNNHGGGAERVLSEVANYLASSGHEVSLLSFDSKRGQSYYSLNESIKRIFLSYGQVDQSATLWETLVRIVKIRKTLKSEVPDVVIAFMHSMFIPLGLAGYGLGIPIVASEHIVPVHYETRAIQKALLYLTPFLCQKITCVSEQAMSAYPSFLQRKMTVLLNPVTAISGKKANVVGQQKEIKILLSVGRLEEQKNHKMLIDAFAMIAKDCFGWELHIVGEGSLRPELERQIASLGLATRILLRGNVKEIDQVYLDAQLYVMPSTYESFGLSVAEALCYGLPVVGMGYCQGVNQLVRHDVNGLLVENVKNPVPELAEKLKCLMNNTADRKRLSQETTNIIEDHYIKNVALQWESMITQVSSRASHKELSSSQSFFAERNLASLYAHVKNFVCRLVWLNSLMGGVIPCARYLLRARGKPLEAGHASYKGSKIRFRNCDLNAIKEVLVDAEYEFLTDVLKEKENPLILDIGAHIGTFSIWAYHQNRTCQTLAVEANPASYDLLVRNTAAVYCKGQCTAINHAAWRNNDVIMFSTEGDTMGNKITPEGDTEVIGVTFKELVEKVTPAEALIDIMKIDIEGAEEAFFETAESVLDRVSSLVIELHPKSCDTNVVRCLLESHFSSVQEIQGRFDAKPVLYCKHG